MPLLKLLIATTFGYDLAGTSKSRPLVVGPGQLVREQAERSFGVLSVVLKE